MENKSESQAAASSQDLANSEKNVADEKGGKDDDAAKGAVGAAPDEEDKEPVKSLLSNTFDKFEAVELLLQRLGQKLGSISLFGDQEQHEPIFEEFNLSAVAKYIQKNNCKNIIVMTGAGISTSAGIPDFRSPESGLYHNLEKYNLPTPQSIFELEYFKENPEPFFMLAKELYPGNYKPTPSHCFIRLLAEKNMLLRNFTQNIDGLEIVAGVPSDLVVAAHGTFHSAHCLDCDKAYSEEWEKERVFKGEIPKCEDCNGIVKPDIVFFGEALPQRFFSLCESDFPNCDLLIVMGTSLVVQPFASMINRVSKTTPRLLINREKTGEGSFFGGGFDFSSERRYRDVAHLTICDDGCFELADLLGWKDELEKLIKDQKDKFEKKREKETKNKSANKSSPDSNKTIRNSDSGKPGAF